MQINMPLIILPHGMLSGISTNCAAYAVGETDSFCHNHIATIDARAQGWRPRYIMRKQPSGRIIPDPVEISWVCPACLEHYGVEDEK